jgi:CubicO group peptidase (beta-lactamase class C family)
MTKPARTFAEVGLFTGVPQHDNFHRLATMFSTRSLRPSSRPWRLPRGAALDIPATFRFGGRIVSTEESLARTDTCALLVLHEGAIVHEEYRHTGGADVPWISWSVAKSFVSAMVGIVIAERLVGSVNEPISDYITVPVGSAYDGVRIGDVLQMASGARWDENYADPSSDISRLMDVMHGRETVEGLVASMVKDIPPGTVCRYNSGDTQALGLLVERATGRSIADFMQERLCEPLGLEDPGTWLLDRSGHEMAFGGLNLTARDYAKFGELYRRGGALGDTPIVPSDWVTDSVTLRPDSASRRRAEIAGEPFPEGYGYQWWLPADSHGDYTAIGIYNQFVYVAPSEGVVAVKLSANRTYGTTMTEETNRGGECQALLGAIARACR